MARMAHISIILILACGIFIPTADLQAQTTWYVDDNAPGDPGPGDPAVSDPSEDGSTGHPFDAIQEAINAATTGDTVLVEDGTYTGVGNKNMDFGGKGILVKSVNGAGSCQIDLNRGGRGFYFHSGEGPSSRLQGFRIKKGQKEYGAAIACENHSDPEIIGCWLSNNYAYNWGGGIDCLDSSPTITNGTIRRNDALGDIAVGGGGISCRGASSPVISNCTIMENRAKSMESNVEANGGGIFCSGSDASPTIINCTISENFAEQLDGGVAHGGGIYCGGGSPTVSGCVISDNEISSYPDAGGGGVYATGGSPTISGCTITGNISDHNGGGMYFRLVGFPLINDCLFMNNSCELKGSAIYCDQSWLKINRCTMKENIADGEGTVAFVNGQGIVPEIHNSIISNNITDGGGAGIYCEQSHTIISNTLIADNDTETRGGGIRIDGADPVIRNCTIVNNISNEAGGGIYCYTDCNPTFTHCILAYNHAPEGPAMWIGGLTPCIVSIDYSDVTGGEEVMYVDSLSTLTWGDGVIHSNPLFEDGLNGDFHLASESPCIDSGDPDYEPQPGETDMDGDERVQQHAIDMGADETPLFRDCNENGIPDIEDISGGYSQDCDENAIPDECDKDCDGNGIPDICDVVDGSAEDCNRNNIPDTCEIETSLLQSIEEEHGFYRQAGQSGPCLPTPADRNGNCILDECETGARKEFQRRATWYVNDDAAGDPGPGTTAISDPYEDGSSYHPFDAIQEAIDVALDGDTVIVADGTYKGVGNRNILTGGKEITVRSADGPDHCVIDPGAQGPGFSFFPNETASTRIEGLTIMNGEFQNGGAFYCINRSSPAIVNCIIKENNANLGGGIYCGPLCAPEIIDCTITGNYSYIGGGGIHCVRTSSPFISGCTIDNNTSGWRSGGIYCTGSQIEVTNSIISNNSSTGRDGGGIGCVENSQVTINGCTVTANFADESGGGIYCEDSVMTITGCTLEGNSTPAGGGIECYLSLVTITDCIIKNNESAFAGGVQCDRSDMVLSGCLIQSNTCTSEGGGGIFCHEASPEIKNCFILDNTVYSHAGGIYCVESSPTIKNCILTGNVATAGDGGAIYLKGDCYPAIQNCTISDNVADERGGGIWSGGTNHPTIVNSIFWNNHAPEGPEMWIGHHITPPGILTISYSDVEGGQMSVYVETGGTLNWGSGMIDADPLFMDPAAGDYHLSNGSPCIDNGDPAFIPEPGETDIDGEDRMGNGRVDMGADEYYE